jgi:hypothetical protein
MHPASHGTACMAPGWHPRHALLCILHHPTTCSVTAKTRSSSSSSIVQSYHQGLSTHSMGGSGVADCEDY